MRPIRSSRSARRSAPRTAASLPAPISRTPPIRKAGAPRRPALGHYIMGGGGKIAEIAVIAERMAAHHAVRRLPPAPRRILPAGHQAASLRRRRRRRDRDHGRDAALRLSQDDDPEMKRRSRPARRAARRARARGRASCSAPASAGWSTRSRTRCASPMPICRAFPSGVTGHAGEVVAGHLAGVPVLMLAGRAHYYEHGDAAAMRPALEVLAGIGIDKLILTNAAGSLEPGHAAGLGHADHRPHQFLRRQSAVRRAERPPLRRPDRSL